MHIDGAGLGIFVGNLLRWLPLTDKRSLARKSDDSRIACNVCLGHLGFRYIVIREALILGEFFVGEGHVA